MMNCESQDQDQDQLEDYVARLPDALVLEIVNKLQDAKSLCRCALVSKRFGSIIPQVDTISLTIPQRNSIHKPYSKRGLFKNLVNKLIVEPLYFLLRVVKPNSSLSKDYDDYSCYSTKEFLKNFNEVRFLHIQFPGHGSQMDLKNDGFLKWKAEFGSKLESCVVLGATSCLRIDQEKLNNQEHEQRDSSSSLTNEELKLRVVWTLSSLIAASTTHHLVQQQQVVSRHPLLESVEITDASKQGCLCMNKDQIQELRNCMESEIKSEESSSMAVGRCRLPASKIKLWHVHELELPGTGYLMKGATLVMVRPDDGNYQKDLVVGTFQGVVDKEKVFDEAVSKMVKTRKVYTLEINSF